MYINEIEVSQKMSSKEQKKFKDLKPFMLIHIGEEKKKTKELNQWGSCMLFKEKLKIKKIG